MKTSQTNRMLYLVYFIYFFNGLALCFEGTFNPEFKEIFNLGYTELMMTMFAKNLPFVLFSILIGHMAQRIGFQKCLTIAMFLFAAGTLLLIPGLYRLNYEVVLLGFFLIGTGFNFQLVAGNPMLSQLGDPEGSSSRLNLGNALGAIAQIAGPLIVSLIIPTTVVSAFEKIPYITGLFYTIAGILVVSGLILFSRKHTIISDTWESLHPDMSEKASIGMNHRLIYGFVAIFLVIGVESAIFGLFRNYIEDPDVAGLSATQSQRLFTVYFALFALGRVVGAFVQRRIKHVKSLIINTIAAIGCILTAVFFKGLVAITSMLLLGFFISIFFPTLYSISIEGFGKNTAKASGLLTMGFLGAAIIPVIQGKIADNFGLQVSFGISLVAYFYVLFFAFKMLRSHSKVQ